MAYDLLIQSESVQEFTAPDGRRWLRSGYCCRCGACCRSGNPFTGEPGDCPIFAWVSEQAKIGECTDRQHPYYLSACQHWPSEPDHIKDYPDCTYIFTEIG